MNLHEVVQKKTIELLDEQIRGQRAKADKAEIERSLYQNVRDSLGLQPLRRSSGASS